METILERKFFKPKLSELLSTEMLFIILGGVPLFLPFLFYLGESRLGVDRITNISWYFWVTAVVSSPHVYATFVRLQGRIKDGENHFFIGIPLYILCMISLHVAYKSGYGLEYATLINVWQSYHYLRQTYGIHRFYLFKDKLDTQGHAKLMHRAFHLTIPYLVLGRWDLLYTVWGGRASSSIIPVNVPDFIMYPLFALFISGIVLGIYAEFKNYKNHRSLKGIIIFSSYLLAHYYGFVVREHYQRGFFVITIYHAVQYMAFVWFFENKRRAKDKVGSLVTRNFYIFYAMILVVCYPTDNYLIIKTSRLYRDLPMYILMGISIHHYTTDSFMWKNKKVN